MPINLIYANKRFSNSVRVSVTIRRRDFRLFNEVYDSFIQVVDSDIRIGDTVLLGEILATFKDTMTQAAIKTYELVIESGGEASYLKMALKNAVMILYNYSQRH